MHKPNHNITVGLVWFKRVAYNLISRMSFLLVEKITLHKIICHVMANNFFVEIFYLLLSQFNWFFSNLVEEYML